MPVRRNSLLRELRLMATVVYEEKVESEMHILVAGCWALGGIFLHQAWLNVRAKREGVAFLFTLVGLLLLFAPAVLTVDRFCAAVMDIQLHLRQ